VLYDDFAASCRDRIAAVTQRFTWETVLTPLVEFCQHLRARAGPVALHPAAPR